jgi:hypothetical protein
VLFGVDGTWDIEVCPRVRFYVIPFLATGRRIGGAKSTLPLPPAVVTFCEFVLVGRRWFVGIIFLFRRGNYDKTMIASINNIRSYILEL